MKSKAVRPLFALVLLVALAPALASAPQSPLGPKTTPEEIKTYETFRAWLGQQPADVQQADDDLHEGALAGPVLAHEPDELAGPHLKRGAAQNLHAAAMPWWP